MPVNNMHSFQMRLDEKKSFRKRTPRSPDAVDWPVHLRINSTSRPLLGRPSSSGIFINFSAVVWFRHSGLPLDEVLFRPHQRLMADLLGPSRGLVMCCGTKSPFQTPVNIPHNISILMKAPDPLFSLVPYQPRVFRISCSALLVPVSLCSSHCSLVTLGKKALLR